MLPTFAAELNVLPLSCASGCKHFVPYDGAALSHASDYDLFSTYLPGFARCIEAGALNIMCSYLLQPISVDAECQQCLNLLF